MRTRASKRRCVFALEAFLSALSRSCVRNILHTLRLLLRAQSLPKRPQTPLHSCSLLSLSLSPCAFPAPFVRLPVLRTRNRDSAAPTREPATRAPPPPRDCRLPTFAFAVRLSPFSRPSCNHVGSIRVRTPPLPSTLLLLSVLFTSSVLTGARRAARRRRAPRGRPARRRRRCACARGARRCARADACTGLRPSASGRAACSSRCGTACRSP